MTDIVDEDDAVVTAAWEILEGETSEGTRNIRRGTTDDDAEFVYRLEDDIDESELDAEDVRSDGEFPEADVTMWRANRDTVEREMQRRDLEGQDNPIEDERLDEETRER